MKDIKLLHDNAPAHTCKVTVAYLKEQHIDILPHPPYSLDLAPGDCHLFPKLKDKLSGKQYTTRSAIATAIYQYLNSLPTEAYFLAFVRWVEHFHKCVNADGVYFEKTQCVKFIMYTILGTINDLSQNL